MSFIDKVERIINDANQKEDWKANSNHKQKPIKELILLKSTNTSQIEIHLPICQLDHFQHTNRNLNLSKTLKSLCPGPSEYGKFVNIWGELKTDDGKDVQYKLWKGYLVRNGSVYEGMWTSSLVVENWDNNFMILSGIGQTWILVCFCYDFLKTWF